MPDENKLYEEWLAATNPWDIEERLYRAVSRHAAAVVLTKFPEGHRDLVHNIAAAVLSQLGEFRGDSKFSTWVQGIAFLKTKEALRMAIRRRRVFDSSKVVVSGPDEMEENANNDDSTRNQVYPTTKPDFDGPIAFEEVCDRLSEEEASLLIDKCEGFTSEEIASKLGIGTEAVDSRWARLKRKLPLSDG